MSFQGYTGAGQTIVIIDDGYSDTFDNGNILFEWDFADDDASAQVPDGLTSHGSLVSSVAQDTASGANYIYLKVFSDGASGASFQDIEAALDWVVENEEAFNISAVNLSLGGGFATTETQTILSDEFAALDEAGVISIAAAGNSNVDGQFEDISVIAADPNVVAVSATDGFGNLAGFSQVHPELTDLTADGTNVAVTDLSGQTFAVSGTSFSAPQVAGAAAVAEEAAVDIRGTGLDTEEFVTVAQATGDRVANGVYVDLNTEALIDFLVDDYLLGGSGDDDFLAEGPAADQPETDAPAADEAPAPVPDEPDFTVGSPIVVAEPLSFVPDGPIGFGGFEITGTVRNEIVVGSFGDDVLTGGGGADIFSGFNSASGNDVILDFDPANDRIHGGFWFENGVDGLRLDIGLNAAGNTVLDLFVGVDGGTIELVGIGQDQWDEIVLTY